MLCIHEPFSSLLTLRLRLQRRACVSSLQGAQRLLFFSGHTWLLCFSVHVLRFLDRCIHGNRTMNGPLKTSSTTDFNTSQLAHGYFTLPVLWKQPLMSQRVKEMSSCQHWTPHSVISTEAVLWHPFFNTLKLKVSVHAYQCANTCANKYSFWMYKNPIVVFRNSK